MIFRLACLILLMGCAPSDRLLRTYTDATRVWQTVSRDAEVFRDRKDHVLARTIILERDGQVRYYLSLSFLRGGPNGPRIREVSAGGQPLAYVRHDRLKAYCIDHCHKTETGQIALTRAAFRQAANDGVILQIHGLRRNYDAQIPARLFYSALEAANMLEPTRKPLPQ